MLTSPIERANASSIFCARACAPNARALFISHIQKSLSFLNLLENPKLPLRKKSVHFSPHHHHHSPQKKDDGSDVMAAEETTRKSHDDEKDAADVVVARETTTNDDAQQINSSASSTGSSFSSKLFLLAFIGLSVALGLREDVGELVKGSGGIENEMTRTMQKEDAISVGDRIHISFCQS